MFKAILFSTIIHMISGCSSSEKPIHTTALPVGDFQSVKYNNPGLTVDLGVGLWAWPLPMDFDLDGDLDLVVACPDKPYNGLYFFENPSQGQEKLPVFLPAQRIGRGEKHLQVSLVNGDPRVLGRGIEYSDFLNSALENPVDLYLKDELEAGFEKIRFSQWKYVDYENDGDLDLLVGIDEWGEYGWDNAFDAQGNWTNGPLHGYVFLVENENGIYRSQGKLMAEGFPIDVYGAPTPNLEDFDSDGDLDLICGEFLDRFTYFENKGSREKPVFAQGRFLSNQKGIIRMDLEMIIPSAVDWDGDGDIDLVVGDEDGRVALVEHTGQVKDGLPVFKDPVYFQQQADQVKFGALITPFAVDWDEDGDQDLIAGNTAGYIGFIENQGGNPPVWDKPRYLEVGGQAFRIMAGPKGSIQGPAEQKWGYTTLSVADWDGDGLNDIIFNSIWGKVAWCRNIGDKGKPKLSPPQPITVAYNGKPAKPAWNWWEPSENQLVTQWRTTPYAIDWNQDGLMDLVMLDHEGFLCFFERYKSNGSLQLKPGQRIFEGINGAVFGNKNEVIDSTSGSLKLNNREAGGSGRRKFTFTDWDQDGDLDLLVNSVNVSLFLNQGTLKGKVQFEHQGNVSDQLLAGHTTSPTMVNWDGDALPDLLVGAEDGHLYYLEREDF